VRTAAGRSPRARRPALAIISVECVAWDDGSIDDAEHIPRMRPIAAAAGEAATGRGVGTRAAAELVTRLLQHAEDEYMQRWMAGWMMVKIRMRSVRTASRPSAASSRVAAGEQVLRRVLRSVLTASILPGGPAARRLLACRAGVPGKRMNQGERMGSSRRWKRAKKLGRGGGVATQDWRGGIKMSDVLRVFADPLVCDLELPEDHLAFEAALKISALLWNEGLLPRERRSTELYAELAAILGSPHDPALEDFFDSMIERGRALYPGLDRFIQGVHLVVDDEGSCRLDVSSIAV
jgi:hypothetical protein